MINWFPGHMAKTKKEISENLKLVDVVLELVDARIPISSRNPLLQEILGDKPLVLILNKADLAEKEGTKKWLEFYRQQGEVALALDSLNRRINPSDKERLYSLVKEQAQDVLKRRAQKGLKNQVVRLMILGVPNVGKSTLINKLRGRGVAGTGDKPGVTKGKQWVRLEKELELLDMPGILWPKFEDPEIGYKLAVTGAIKEETFNYLDLSLWLISWLKKEKPDRIAQRYQVDENQEAVRILEGICRQRGLLLRGGEVNLEKGAHIFLVEYRQGKLGRVTLDVY